LIYAFHVFVKDTHLFATILAVFIGHVRPVSIAYSYNLAVRRLKVHL
jgi:hypothetical protein